VFALISFGMVLSSLWVELPIWSYPFWGVFICFCSFSCCIINHNHSHVPIFTSNALNFVFNLILTIAKGHSSTTVIVPHNFNHHVYSGSAEDWINTDLAGQGPGLVRLIRYIWRASRMMSKERAKEGTPRLPQALARSLAFERATLFAFCLVAIAVDWKRFVFLIAIPWLFAMAALVGVNLLQHDGCRPGDPFQDSRNFLSPLGNWLLFNNGYHMAHHLKPSLHWSLLPAEHQKFESRIPPEQNESSILSYLFKRYLFQWS
jgi:fatty acid desaturase